ncbi:MAG: DNA mismatch repair endonuclease MutL [Dehalococcoidales bacterium]
MPIKILDNETINRIAAGEVVERPASCVKELVENALDAGATQIGVEIRGGGISLIRVTDNGSGIPSNEVALAFERYATSKIKSPADLQNIGSLGFRGEALPSIAAVADVELLTCADGESAGTLIVLEGGKIVKQQRGARARGTTITARELFRRVPARLKFLKAVSTESSHVANVVSQFALAFPEVGFALSVDGKPTLQTSGKGRLLDAIIDVYGMETAGKMLPVEGRSESWSSGQGESNIRVTGMVGSPEVSRGGRGYLSFFVNRRWVTNRILAYAVEEAYVGLLMTGRHPVAVLAIELPLPEVDVNIHPAKSEVKFRNESEVFRAVQKAVRQSLVAQMPVPKIEEAAATYAAPPSYRQQAWDLPRFDESNRALPETVLPLAASLPALRVVGQVMNCYIVAEGPDGLYIIDQHAAHERVRFEKVLRQRAQRAVEVQGLLEPATFELTPRQAEILKSCNEELAQFGFSLEPFGERTYLVRAVPLMVAGDNWAGMLHELLDMLSGEAKGHWEEKIVASIACHGAVRSGQALSDDEMRELVRQLEQTSNPHTCPHGRPTVIQLGKAQLEREFGRG